MEHTDINIELNNEVLENIEQSDNKKQLISTENMPKILNISILSISALILIILMIVHPFYLPSLASFGWMPVTVVIELLALVGIGYMEYSGQFKQFLHFTSLGSHGLSAILLIFNFIHISARGIAGLYAAVFYFSILPILGNAAMAAYLGYLSYVKQHLQ